MVSLILHSKPPHSRIVQHNGQDKQTDAQKTPDERKYRQRTEPLDGRPVPLIFKYSHTLYNVRLQLVSSMKSMSNMVYIFSSVAGMYANDFRI